ncbi:MAG: PaaI family thioesterase [bacterium]|nr:PaaI family thioesterase [bacterium]
MADENRIRTGPVRAPLHAACWVCGQENPQGLQVDFVADDQGEVTGIFPCDVAYAGYPGFVQGGVVAALLDSAMTNCLFAAGCTGVTADLQVRYLQPVLVGRQAVIRARLDQSRRLTWVLSAEITQDSTPVARAVGKFMKHPDADPS